MAELQQRLGALEAENRDLRRTRRLHEALLESAVDYAIFTLDRDLRITSWNSGGERMLGWSAREILGRPGHIIFTPEDRDRGAVESEAAVALAEGRAVNERWHLCKDGSRLWGSGLTMPLRDSGTSYGFVKIMRDQTEKRRAEQRQKLLTGELTHRVKNTLAVVQSLAELTLRSTPDPAIFATAFRERIGALARAHDLLTREVWSKASITGVTDVALGAWMTEGRITCAGPEIWLTPQQALTLSLALHELATNAVKYGALSVPQGRVDLAWHVRGEVRLLWRESGGPPVRKPERTGFGTRILTRALAQDMKGEVRLLFEPDGLRLELVFPPPDLAALERDLLAP